jgi:hypothetical protein
VPPSAPGLCRLLLQEWPLALALLSGLLALKITVISALGPLFGLSRAESIRTGFILSQVRSRQRGGLGSRQARLQPGAAGNVPHRRSLPPCMCHPPCPPPPRMQGGEFAFVLLALANQLNVLPAELNRLLIIVVVLSMALTPMLTEVGKRFATRLATPGGDGEGWALGGPAGVSLWAGALVALKHILAAFA